MNFVISRVLQYRLCNEVLLSYVDLSFVKYAQAVDADRFSDSK